MSKIGLYSGTFDPIHQGHIAFARYAVRQLGLHKVYFMVESMPRRKTQVTNARHRLIMAWLATQDYPELELLTLEQPTFTVADTLPWLQERYAADELYLLMGSDLFNHVQDWQGFERLRRAMHFVVGYRTGENALSVEPDVAHHAVTTPLLDVTSRAVRAGTEQQRQALVPALVAQYIHAHQLYSAG